MSPALLYSDEKKPRLEATAFRLAPFALSQPPLTEQQSQARLASAGERRNRTLVVSSSPGPALRVAFQTAQAEEYADRSMESTRVKMQKQLRARENTRQRQEAEQKKAQELLSSKEKRLEEVALKLQRLVKEQGKRFKQSNSVREEKAKQVKERERQQLKRSEEQYKRYLEEVQCQREAREKLQRDACEQDFRRYNAEQGRTAGTLRSLRRQLALEDREAAEALAALEQHALEHQQRQALRKSEASQQVAQALARVARVQDSHRERQAQREAQRLEEFLARQERAQLRLSNLEKLRVRQQRTRSQQNQEKNLKSSRGFDQSRAEQIADKILKAQMQAEAKIQETKQRRELEVLLAREREALRVQDQRKKLEKQRAESQARKEQIMLRHMQADEKISLMREAREQQSTFSRVSAVAMLRSVSS